MDPSLKQVQNQFSATEVIAKEYSYTWTIKNPRNLEKGTVLDSPLFTWGEENRCKWKFSLNYGAQCCANPEFLCLKLFPIETFCKHKTFYLVLSYNVWNKNFVLLSKTVHTKCLASNNPLICHSFAKNDVVDLKVVCKIYYEGEVITHPLESYPMSDVSPIDYNCSKDFEKLFENEKLSDVTLVVDEEKFRVHKAILAARSSVFATIFDCYENEEEGDEFVLKIDDVKATVMKEFLRFVYAGKIKEGVKGIELELLPLADKYGIDMLREMCEIKLIPGIDSGNAVEYLVLADRHQATRLRDCAMNFIVTNAATILQTEKFKIDMKQLSRDFGEICLELLAKLRA